MANLLAGLAHRVALVVLPRHPGLGRLGDLVVLATHPFLGDPKCSAIHRKTRVKTGMKQPKRNWIDIHSRHAAHLRMSSGLKISKQQIIQKNQVKN